MISILNSAKQKLIQKPNGIHKASSELKEAGRHEACQPEKLCYLGGLADNYHG